MGKQVRPLSAFKKEEPELYKQITDSRGDGGKSKKHMENDFYFFYCFYGSGIIDFEDDGLHQKIMSGAGASNPAWHFFRKDSNSKNHITTITEMGRLLLTGWYYNIEDFTKNICLNIYNGYLKANEQGKGINDQEFAGAVKHIRVNIVYYHLNQAELKIYLLNEIFRGEVKKYLPEPPEALQKFEDIIAICKIEKEGNLIEDPDYYYHRSGGLESYADYLQGLLDEYGIDYKTLEQHQEEEKQWIENWMAGVDEERQAYNEKCKKQLLETKLLT